MFVSQWYVVFLSGCLSDKKSFDRLFFCAKKRYNRNVIMIDNAVFGQLALAPPTHLPPMFPFSRGRNATPTGRSWKWRKG
jgi:hypothetical protein